MRSVAIDPVLSVVHAYEVGAETTVCLAPLDSMEIGDLVARSMQTVSLCERCRFG